MAAEEWRVVLRGPEGRYPARTVVEDIDYPMNWREHLLEMARLDDPSNTDGGQAWIARFELWVYEPNSTDEPRRVFRWVD